MLTIGVFSGCNVNIGSGDIVILFTGGVNNEASSGVGYEGVAAYKRLVSSTHNFTALVDCGNSLSGGMMDMVAGGAYAAKIMNEVGYDYYSLGGGDLSLGASALSGVAESFSPKAISANAFFDDDDAFPLTAYAVEQFASKSVAYVGVTDAVRADGCFASDGSELVSDVQEALDAVKDCSYVILLSGLGEKASTELVSSLKGKLDAVLDSDENTVAQKYLKNSEGNDILYSSSGDRLRSVGQLLISSDGTVTSTNVVFEGEDEDISLVVKTLDDEYSSKLDRVIATSESPVKNTNDSGIVTTANRENAIGDLVADAYRAAGNAQIGLVSASEIASGLPSGDIRLEDIVKALPNGGTVSVATVTGQQILDCLEFAVKDVMSYSSSNGEPVGTFDGFLQVSGISFSIHASRSTSVGTDENGVMTEIGETRRISDVRIENGEGESEAIDPEATYIVAGNVELLKGASNGNTAFKDSELNGEIEVQDYEALLNYVNDTLSGDLSAYSASGKRISM